MVRKEKNEVHPELFLSGNTHFNPFGSLKEVFFFSISKNRNQNIRSITGPDVLDIF